MFLAKTVVNKMKDCKRLSRSKDLQKTFTIEKLLQTKFINTKLLAKKLLINEIIETNTRTMNNEAIDKNC